MDEPGSISNFRRRAGTPEMNLPYTTDALLRISIDLGSKRGEIDSGRSLTSCGIDFLSAQFKIERTSIPNRPKGWFRIDHQPPTLIDLGSICLKSIPAPRDLESMSSISLSNRLLASDWNRFCLESIPVALQHQLQLAIECDFESMVSISMFDRPHHIGLGSMFLSVKSNIRRAAPSWFSIQSEPGLRLFSIISSLFSQV
ncbi:hypothetical protein KEM48_004439 [Puccinia striiformis f. sp. tritici PST-130]|nr:hypothetical protein KEM48_004439 [Puccinia striiformis f. sp. tritici PST-130]